MPLPDEGMVVCPFCGQWIEIVHWDADTLPEALPPIEGLRVARPVYIHEPPFCQKFEDLDADAFTALLMAGTES